MSAIKPGEEEEGWGGEGRAGHRPLPPGEGCEGPGQAARPRGRAEAGAGEGLPRRERGREGGPRRPDARSQAPRERRLGWAQAAATANPRG